MLSLSAFVLTLSQLVATIVLLMLLGLHFNVDGRLRYGQEVIQATVSIEHTREERSLLCTPFAHSLSATEGNILLKLQRVAHWLHSMLLVDLVECFRGSRQVQIVTEPLEHRVRLHVIWSSGISCTPDNEPDRVRLLVKSIGMANESQ